MTILDWIIIAVLAVSLLLGLMRGLVREALSIISWIAAFWLAKQYCVPAGEYIAGIVAISEPILRVWIGYAAVFILTLVVLSIVSYVLNKILASGGLKVFDRFLGTGFGLLRGVAIIAILILALKAFSLNNTDMWKDSRFVPHFEPAAAFLESVLPKLVQAFDDDEEVETDEDKSDANTDNKIEKPPSNDVSNGV